MQTTPQPPIVIVCGPLPAGEPIRVTGPTGRLTLTWDPRQISRADLLAAAEKAARDH